MGGDKQGSKGGGYVGGFLQLFDWNAKSRKKLFSSKTDIPDHTKQKKRRDGNLPTTRFNLVEMDEDDYVVGSSIKGSSDYSCASSVTDEEGFGSRAPSVVARLMGLDSMPTSNVTEPFSTPFFDSQSLRESQYSRRNIEFCQENQNMHSGNLNNKVDASIQKAPKTMNRPIEKFQTEILPPKSAKSIPITQHKLLSPIKSPGFISSKNAAHIMEAAAKIIEPGPQATNKTKMPLVGTSSVPFKVRELREKVEASQKPSRRPVESNAAKTLRGQALNKSWNGSPDSEDRSGINNKGKSISLALQAKVNVQKREGRKEPSEIIANQAFKSQTNTQKYTQKRTTTPNTSGVLKPNNQKQNCSIDKEKLSLKSSLSNSQGTKLSSADSSLGRHKNSSKYGGNSKVGSRKLSSEATNSKEEVLYSNTKNLPRKKRSLDGNFHTDKNQIVNSMLVDSNEKPIQSNLMVDRHFTCAEESKRKGIDVVSFTFTAPLSRQNNVFCSDYRGKKAMLNLDSRNSGKLSSVGCNVIGADDLSILLEQKLRELTHGSVSSRYREGMTGGSAPIFQNSVPTPNAVPNIPKRQNEKCQDEMHMEISDGQCGSSSYTSKALGFMAKHSIQGTLEVDECRSDNTETRKSLYYRHPSPISVLEPSFMTESCNSSDTADSINVEGSKQCSSVQGLEVLGSNSYKNLHLMEIDTELSDSASSSSTKALAKGKKAALSMTSFVVSRWELEYVNEVLFNVELMFKDFALGRAREIVNPHLFDQLENHKEALEEHPNENKLERKVLFDCVGECMDLRCRRYADGGFRMWAKGLSTLRRKDQLAEEVYKEILGWKGMEDSMVDDLVDKDMSSQYGKWLDFEVEAFEFGVEIEGRILNSLVNEVVADLLIQ